MGVNSAFGRAPDAKVAVLIKGTKAFLELGIFGVGCNEALGGHAVSSSVMNWRRVEVWAVYRTR
jgi:hypothetical protein